MTPEKHQVRQSDRPSKEPPREPEEGKYEGWSTGFPVKPVGIWAALVISFGIPCGVFSVVIAIIYWLKTAFGW